MSARIPPEVWYLIAGHLHQVELPPLLLVSRFHRLVALKRLFSHLKICFAYPDSGNTPHTLLEVTRDETKSLSWEMLSRVRCDKTFASVIQRITIYYSTEELQDVDYFHNGVIVEALRALTNLSSFAWVGNGSPLMDIMQKIPSCCPKLQEISVTYVWFHFHCLMVVVIFTYHRFSSVEDMVPLGYPDAHPAGLKSILCQYNPEAHMNILSLGHSNHVNSLIGDSESTVRSLSICADPLWRVPVRIFENISHLDIFLGQDMENIALVFRYAAQLESLSVLGLDNRAIFRLLEDHPDSLPSLRSFKIMSPYREWQPDVDIEEPQLLSLVCFLRNKKELRALDIHLWPQGWSSLSPFWDLLRQSPSLEVLGITTGAKVFTKDDFLSFAAALPPKLSALRVSTQWDISGEEENRGCFSFVRTFHPSASAYGSSKHPIQIEALDKISFFYMRNYNHSFAFLSDELAQELPSVKILGLDQVMSYVIKDGENGVEVVDWSARRCFTRTVEDFDGNEDWEWLLRHHDLGEWAW